MSRLTDEQIQQVVTDAVHSGRLSWLGYQKDADGRYTIPQLNPRDFQLARAIEQAVLAAPEDAKSDLHTFLNASAGEGLVLDGIDAADLYVKTFPMTYAATCASIDYGRCAE